MDKKVLRITEEELNRIVTESVRCILGEGDSSSIVEIMSLHSKAMDVLMELYAACERVSSENIKVSLRSSVGAAIRSLSAMFP